MKYTSILFCSLILSGMCGSPIEFSRASINDIDAVMALADKEMVNDNDSLVTYPSKFRRSIFAADIRAERLFIAFERLANGTKIVVALKKLYLINDSCHLKQMLDQEIRIHTDPVLRGRFEDATYVADSVSSIDYYSNALNIYSGLSYTVKSHRGFGLNKKLTQLGFEKILQSRAVYNLIKASAGLVTINLLFGCVAKNCGKKPIMGRTGINLRFFEEFIRRLYTRDCGAAPERLTVVYCRYPSFLPSFDEDATSLTRLPDAAARVGYGCILSHSLNLACCPA